jgi:acetyl/propionyl-CoA carboxylase alpha subunit
LEFEFTLNGERRRVSTDGRRPLTTVTIDGTAYEVDWSRIREGVISLLMDGRSHTVQVARSDGGLTVDVDGQHFVLGTGSRDDDSAVAAGAGGGGGGIIKAPMPGSVVKVMVAEGDEVTVGTGIVVVEAMKMENEVRSEVDGTVKKVNVAAGDSVGTSEVMVEIEAAD